MQKNFKEKFMVWLVWLLPKSIVYYCAIRLIVHATDGKYGSTVVPKLGAIEALERWETA